METRKIQGLFPVGISEFENTKDWYYQVSDLTDFYDLNMMAVIGEDLKGSEIIFIKNPEGQVFKPFNREKGIYYNNPAFIDGKIYFLKADFNQGSVSILEFGQEESREIFSIAISDINLYNLELVEAPIMLVSSYDDLEIYYPEKLSIKKEGNESFLFRDGEKFYFSAWFEEGLGINGTIGTDYNYYEEIVVKDKESNVLSKYKGAIFITKDGEVWEY